MGRLDCHYWCWDACSSIALGGYGALGVAEREAILFRWQLKLDLDANWHSFSMSVVRCFRMVSGVSHVVSL
jgi:hypothetical protein